MSAGGKRRLRPARIALSGYYGFGNAGDEAVLAGLIKAFRETPGGGAGSLDLLALSIAPPVTVAAHGVDSAHRYRVAPLVRALAWCDLLASGGGSLLQDVTSRHSIFYYLGVVRAAQILGKRTMFIAQGIGPLLAPRSRKLTAAVARRCDALTVRDESSAALLREIGVARPEIVVAADPALLLGADRPYVPGGAAISLRPWHGAASQLPEMVARACHAALGKPIVSSMTMSIDDAAPHDRFFDAFNASFGLAPAARHAPEAVPWSTLTLLAADTGLVIGMRLHALILAAANGVPAVALSYDPKVDAFMRQTGQSDAVFDIREPDEERLSAMIAGIWAGRCERADRLRSSLPALRDSARLSAEAALTLVR